MAVWARLRKPEKHGRAQRLSSTLDATFWWNYSLRESRSPLSETAANREAAARPEARSVSWIRIVRSRGVKLSHSCSTLLELRPPSSFEQNSFASFFLYIKFPSENFGCSMLQFFSQLSVLREWRKKKRKNVPRIRMCLCFPSELKEFPTAAEQVVPHPHE